MQISKEEIEKCKEISPQVIEELNDLTVSNTIRGRLKQLICRVLKYEDLNLDSADVLRYILYTKLQYPVIAMTRACHPKVDMETLRKLADIKREIYSEEITNDLKIMGNVVLKKDELNNSKYPIALLLLTYKKYEKLGI